MPIIAVVLFYLLRFSRKRKNPLLVLSFCITFTGVPLFTLFQVWNQMPGAFGQNVSVFPCIIFGFLFFKTKTLRFKSLINFWVIGLLILLLANYCMPQNVFKPGFFPPLFTLLQLFFFLQSVRHRFTLSEIYDALYESFAIWTIMEFVLAMCYPVLGMQFVSTLFCGDLASQWANRRVGYLSAVGTFPHPSQLAYVCVAFASFFFVAFLNNRKRKESLLLFIASVIVVVLTFSRMSYLALFLALTLIYLFNRNRRISFKYLFYLLLFPLILYLVTFIPAIQNLFFKSDASNMAEARFVHWFIGLEIWGKFKLLGTGINDHVYYMTKHFMNLRNLRTENEFIISNPIHNIHLIVLAETGIIGAAYWLLAQGKLLKQGYQQLVAPIYEVQCGGLLLIALTIFTFAYGFTGWSFFNIAVYTPYVTILYLFYRKA